MPYYTDQPDPTLDIDWPEKEWAPVYWTGMKSEHTLGDKIADFIQEFMTPPRKFGDKPFQVLPWQRWWLRHAFELDEKTGLLRWREVYLQIPRKNGKSFLTSGINLYFAAKANEGDRLLLAASSAKQANIVYGECLRNLRASPVLQLVLNPGANAISNKYVNAQITRVAGDGHSSQGDAPFISTGDELHTWDSETGRSNRGERLLESLTTGSSDRLESLFLGITTAGDKLDGIAYSRYEKTKAIATGTLEDPTFAGFVWEAEEEDDISDPETWMKANPNLREGIQSLDEWQKMWESAESLSTTAFERYHLNKWLRGGDRQNFISMYYWGLAYDENATKIPENAEIVVGFDGSQTEDSTGIVAIDVNTGLIELLHAWEKDPTNKEWFVDDDEVQVAMETIFSKYKVLRVYADPSRHRDMVRKWQRTWGRGVVRDIPPTSARMAQMSQAFKQAVYTGELKHAGDARLTNHVRNAIETVKGVPNKESPSSARKIDFVACAVLAHGAFSEVKELKTRRSGGIRAMG